MLVFAAVVLISYLLGSIPAGYLVGRIAGIDIRHAGSGNIGATNVTRVLGKRYGYPVFVVDFLKGLMAVSISILVEKRVQPVLVPTELLGIVAAISCVIGHSFPVWLSFKGGKGVATSMGALFGLVPFVALIGVAVWVITFEMTRYVSVASMTAALAVPISILILMPLKQTGGAVLLYFSICLTAVQAEVKIDKIAILGAGSWGTALAWLWGKHERRICLWGNSPDRVERVKRTRENSDYIPGLRLPDSVNVTHELRDCAEASLIVFVTPSTALREIATRLREVGREGRSMLLSCTKGIEHGTGMRMSQILSEIFPRHELAVLSGPNLAAEVIRGLPTATVIGCRNLERAANLQDFLGSSRFRIYTSDDVTSIELGGALKNVFAIAAGASDGLGLGDNKTAALVTRSLAEMIRLGTAMGGNVKTFYGLSGAGDLIATCFSKHSRNRRVGEQLGRGQTLKQITSSMKMVAEGIPTAKSAFACARKLKIDTPIIDQVDGLLYKGKVPVQAMHELLERDQKAEQV